MVALPAYDGITLALGDHAVRLRPTLRAADRLPSPPDLWRAVLDLHTGTLADLITRTASDHREAEAFLAAMDATPLQTVRSAITAPLLALIAGFNPSTAETKGQASQTDARASTSAKPMALAEVVSTLYRRATGWLGWTPDTAWNATPTEISEALAGWIAMQEALHGTADKPAEKRPDAYTTERLAGIEELGHDPAFDREGLRALKANR